MAQPTTSAGASSSSVRPPRQSMQTSAVTGRGRVGASGSGDIGSTLSYISPFVASKWDTYPELLHKSFEVSMPISEFVVVRWVYRNCDVKIHDRHMLADLHDLEMVDFDIIMGERIIEWKGDVAVPKGKFISYLKARRMILKGYIYHLVRVHDMEVKSPTLQSVPVVNEFPNVFPDELPGLPPESEITLLLICF
ncbi:uncharacterized protein LOC142165364 [Nicotiana tabacum]|uniref:Uncharacterized protein LOC142165364 n=1 Tax=Nicotiana tabacum TaxID=4097 RepID=A0AC58S4W5_TOBAC